MTDYTISTVPEIAEESRTVVFDEVPSSTTASRNEKPSAQGPTLPGPLQSELVTSEFIALIPRDFARQHLVISQGVLEDVERVAVTESTDQAAVFNIGVKLHRTIEPFVANDQEIARLIDDIYGRMNNPTEQSTESGHDYINDTQAIDQLLASADRDLLSTEGKGPVIKLVDALLFEAVHRKASDVHVQPLADKTLIRYRLDGVLHTVRELRQPLTSPVISRIKVMGRMDIAERRVPQDGRASVTIGSRSIDLRISTLPTSYGERAVIRLLDNSEHLCDFEKLGMPPQVARPYLERASRANGLILLTGPTGSGKTTTLYSTLRLVGSSELNIMTIEDPIEYELSFPGVGLAISQSQVNPKKGVTFATGLRHILRQDPDVVMIGEIRDAETARIAVQSSLTGHLVLSTLHTNDAPSAITRLIDLGIESYLVSAAFSAVLAQRLVRLAHQPCMGAGCPDCLQTGFRGRTGLFELLVVIDAIAEQITTNRPLLEIRQAAHQSGMTTLRQDGERLVRLGLTTQAEVDRVVHGAAEL